MMDYLKSEVFRKAVVPVIFGTAFAGALFLGVRRRQNSKNSDSKKNKKVIQLPVNELPLEIRVKIWQKLNFEDILKLRSASKSLKDEVDNWVGLRLVVSSRKQDKFEFAQSVGLQGVVITDLNCDIDNEFFAQPVLLEHLVLIERTSIPRDNLQILLEPCTNLTTLNLRFIYASDVSAISETVLNAISNMHYLKNLKIHRCASHVIEEKRFPREVTSESPRFHPKNLEVIELDLADISEEQVARWKILLDQQHRLKHLGIKFGAIHWHFFVKAISNNPALEGLSLFGLKSYCIVNEQDIPIDWTIFTHLQNLKFFEAVSPRTAGRRGSEIATSRNFYKFPGRNIEKFHLNRIILSTEDVDKIYTQMPKMTEGSLNNIGEAGMIRATELSWLQGQDQNQWNNAEDFLENRLFNAIFQCLLGLSMLSIALLISRNRRALNFLGIEDDFDLE